MDNLTRNPSIIKSKMKTIGNKVIALEDIKIYIPLFYIEKKLAVVEERVTSLGIALIVYGSVYGVLSVNTRITFSPSETNQRTVKGEPMIEMIFPKGSTIIEDNECVKKDTLPYFIYDTFISKGKIPWFMGYEDMCRLFSTAKKYADSGVGDKSEVIEMMISLIARDSQDRTKYFRQVVDQNPSSSQRLTYIPMKSVEYGATNTLNRLGGAYFQTGVVSSLINPTEHVENIEEILRQ